MLTKQIPIFQEHLVGCRTDPDFRLLFYFFVFLGLIIEHIGNFREGTRLLQTDISEICLGDCFRFVRQVTTLHYGKLFVEKVPIF